MMNSMNRQENRNPNTERPSWIAELEKSLELKVVDSPMSMQYILDVAKDKLHQALVHLRHIGFTQLSLLTCVDWIDKNEFQLVYIVFNWENGIHLLVRTTLDRDNPSYHTIIDIYPGAIYYEREVYEFFGVTFEGNPTYDKALFLERWDAMPPLRKDFDPQAYSDAKFPKREIPEAFKSKVVEVKS